jgi:hypothetical protein
MGHPVRLRRVLQFVALAIFALLLGPLVTVKVRGWVFRYRAERLLNDVRVLQMRRASLPEMKTAFRRWGWDNLACSEQSCYMGAGISLYPTGPGSSVWAQIWARLLRMYGARSASITAEVYFNGGALEKNSIELKLAVPSTLKPWREEQIDLLSAGAIAVSRFYIVNDWRGLALHPHYVLGGGHARSMHLYHPDIYVVFDSQVDPGVINRLVTLDLSCITRWRPCRKPSDLMPAAEAQYESEYPLLLRARTEHICSPTITRLMARDSSYAGVVEFTGVSRNNPVYREGVVSLPTVRLVENFRPDSHWKEGELRSLEVYDVNTDRVFAVLPPEVRRGNRFIVLAGPGRGYRSVRAEACGVLPLNDENLEIVRSGIAENRPTSQ